MTRHSINASTISFQCRTSYGCVSRRSTRASTMPSNCRTIRGWHAGMRVINILCQLSLIYGQPTPMSLEANNHIFRSPTSAANAPEVLFRRIEECAKKRCSVKILRPTNNSSPTQSASSSPRVCISACSKIGTNWQRHQRLGSSSND